MNDPHCPRCQAPAFADTRYCWSCGFDLGDPETRGRAEAPVAPEAAAAATDGPPATPDAPVPAARSARLLRYGAAAIVGVVAIAVVASLPGLVGSGPAAASPTGSGATPSGATATASPEPWASLAPTGRTTEATVVRIVDGDTIVVDIDGAEARVRYIGMDAPESVKPDSPVEAMGKEAAAANAALVESQAVILEQDVSDTDRFGRLLRDVWVQRDGDLVLAGLELVRDGYAQVSTFPPDVRYASMLLTAQHDAQQDGVGLWASSAAASPSAATSAAPVASLPTFTSVTPVLVTSGHKSSFRGAIGVYTWRDVRFGDPSVRMTWDVHSNLASGCRIDWQIQPLDGPAVKGFVKVKGKGRTTGKRNLAVPVGDAPLEVRSTCSEWLITMQGKAA